MSSAPCWYSNYHLIYYILGNCDEFMKIKYPIENNIMVHKMRGRELETVWFVGFANIWLYNFQYYYETNKN